MRRGLNRRWTDRGGSKAMSKREFDSSFSRLLHPDFSMYVRDGVFDGHGALETHLMACDVLLRVIVTLSAAYVEDLPGFPSFEDRLYVIEAHVRTYREAIEAGVTESYRMKKEFPEAPPEREPGAPGFAR